MIDRAEIIRYLGYGKQVPDASVQGLIEACVAEVERASEAKSIMRRFPVKVTEDTVEAAGLIFQSRQLARNLKDCREVVFFAGASKSQNRGNCPDGWGHYAAGEERNGIDGIEYCAYDLSPGGL